MLELVGSYRVLNTRHVIDLLGVPRDKHGRSQTLERRLNLLFQHGYLNRSSLDEWRLSGSRPVVYTLESKGKKLLERERDVTYPAGRITQRHIEHQHFISDLSVASTSSCRAHNVPRHSLEEVIATTAPNATRKAAETSRVDGWRVETRHNKINHKLKVYPDEIFALPEQKTLFLVEADRGTEPLRRNDLRHRSSILKKFLLYKATAERWKNTSHPPYGYSRPRVLFVVSSQDPHTRIANIQELGRELKLMPGFVLLAAHNDLIDDDFLTHEWRDLKGRKTRILPEA